MNVSTNTMFLNFVLSKRDAITQIPTAPVGSLEITERDLRPSATALPEIPSGHITPNSGALETSGREIQSKPENRPQRAGSGCTHSHLLPTGVAGRPVGWRGLGMWLQIRK